MLIFQCLCFMKNAGGFEINLNIEKKSNLSVLIVFPNCHFYVDIHKHCSFKQHFASQSFWQYCFPCAASDVKSLNFEALHNIGLPCLSPIWCQMPRSCSQVTPNVSIPQWISASPPLLCTVPHAWEEISVNACWATLWSPSNPSFPPLCSDACRDHADSQAGDVLWLLPIWSHSFHALPCLPPSVLPPLALRMCLCACHCCGGNGSRTEVTWHWLMRTQGARSSAWGTSQGPGVQHSSSPGCRSRHSSPALLPTCVCGDPAPWSGSHPELDPLQITLTQL